MLIKDELDFLSKILKNKKASIKPFDPKAKRIGDLIVSRAKDMFPGLKVLFMGATALEIVGQVLSNQQN